MNTLALLIASILPQAHFAALRLAAYSPVTLGWSEAKRVDSEMSMPVYVIRGGTQPKAVPNHVWSQWSLDYQSDNGPNWTWRLYRLEGAGPLRKTDIEPYGTWVPAELDTPAHRERRAKIGLTNYEIAD